MGNLSIDYIIDFIQYSGISMWSVCYKIEPVKEAPRY